MFNSVVNYQPVCHISIVTLSFHYPYQASKALPDHPTYASFLLPFIAKFQDSKP